MFRYPKYRVLIWLTLMVLLLVLAQSVAVAQGASPHLVVNTFRLNVRSGPGVGHAIITTVAGGTELPVTLIGSDGKWYQVTSSAGSGWVHTAYAVPRGDFSGVPRQDAVTNLGGGTSIAEGAAHVVVNTSYLNVRTGPGLGHTILTTVQGGTVLAVTAIDSGGVWYQVETSAGSGWLNSNYAVARGSFAVVSRTGGPAVLDPTSQPDVSPSAAHLVVNTSFLNVRTGPGVGHDILTTVRGGTLLPVIAIGSDRVWYQVETSAGNGWVNSRYTVGRGDFSGVSTEGADLSGSTPRAVVNTAFLNVRTGPGVGHSTVTTVQGGTTLAVLGISGDRDWYKVEGSFGQGWLHNYYVVFRGDFSQVSVVS